MRAQSATRESPSATPKLSLRRLPLIFVKVGSIGFGGGMAIVSIMDHELVRKRRLLSLGEFLSGVGFGQILGSFAVNVSLFVGLPLTRVCPLGEPELRESGSRGRTTQLPGRSMGALVATVALMTPAAVLMLAISRQYERFVTTTMHNAFCPG